ncbi:uncharacterized protein LOC123010346 [Tribolium madens]|uniref:uncharacterized protein LOC123010346 n=1 Tax=Tribolium madens TaxID=41895 RepID=UPI001CF72F0E|nr:uncharacterized protein LOC123010346 [Tribolium madens]
MYTILNPILTVLALQKNNTCLRKIIENDFSNASTLTVLSDNFADIYVPEIPVVFRNFGIKNFLVYGDKFEIGQNFNPKGKYVFVSENQSKVLKLVEENQLKKFLVVQKGQILYPYNTKSCTTLQLVKSRNCHYPHDIFKKKKFFDKNCRLKVGYIKTPPYVINVSHPQRPGVMVSLMNLISELSGFKLEYQNSNRYQYELLSNGTIHKISRDLDKSIIDVAIGQLALNDTKTNPFDYGPVIYSDCLHLVAPKPKKLKSYRKLFVVFNLELWKKIFIGIGVMILVFYIFALCEDFENASFINSMFDVFMICTGGGVSQIPQWLSFRILVSFFLLFCLSLDSIYLGNLSNIFAQNSYDVKVNNFETAGAVKIVLYVDWRVERHLLLVYVTSRYKAAAKKRLFITNHSQTYLMNHTALTKQNGTFLFKSVLEAFPSEESLLFHFRLTTDYLTFLVAFYMNKKIHFGEALAFWGQEIVERGFLVKWFNDIRRSNVRPEILPEEEKKIVVLKLAHFEESFRVLLGGYALGLIAFILEFVFLKLEKIGFVQKVKDNVMFLLRLLKPPERVFKERIM